MTGGMMGGYDGKLRRVVPSSHGFPGTRPYIELDGLPGGLEVQMGRREQDPNEPPPEHPFRTQRAVPHFLTFGPFGPSRPLPNARAMRKLCAKPPGGHKIKWRN